MYEPPTPQEAGLSLFLFDDFNYLLGYMLVLTANLIYSSISIYFKVSCFIKNGECNSFSYEYWLVGIFQARMYMFIHIYYSQVDIYIYTHTYEYIHFGYTLFIVTDISLRIVNW